MKKYDIVVIGSGLGGLSTALILAINGYKVCVLEKNRISSEQLLNPVDLFDKHQQLEAYHPEPALLFLYCPL